MEHHFEHRLLRSETVRDVIRYAIRETSWAVVQVPVNLYRGVSFHRPSSSAVQYAPRTISFWFDDKTLAETCARYDPKLVIAWTPETTQTVLDLTSDDICSLMTSCISSGIGSVAAQGFMDAVVSRDIGSSAAFEDDFALLTYGCLPGECIGYKRRTAFSTHGANLVEYMVFKTFLRADLM